MGRIVTSDGEVPFTRPVAGVDPVASQDLVTKAWGLANLGGGGGGGGGTGEVIDLGDRMTGAASISLGARV